MSCARTADDHRGVRRRWMPSETIAVRRDGITRWPAPRAGSGGERGFSVLEIVVVLAIIGIMTSICIFAFLPAKRVAGSDDAALQFTRFMRDASTRSLTQRQRARVFVNNSTSNVTVGSATPAITCKPQTIMLIDEGAVSTGDESVVRSEALANTSLVSIQGKPSIPSTQPATPWNFATAAFTSNTFQAYYNPDGSVTDGTATPMSFTLYIYPTTVTAQNQTLVRAVTVFGPTGAMRMWRCDPAVGWVQR